MIGIVQNELSSPDVFLTALKTISEQNRSELMKFIETYRELIAEGVKNGYSSVVIFDALKSSGTPPPMSYRQFRRYVSQIKCDMASTVALAPVLPSSYAVVRPEATPMKPLSVATKKTREPNEPNASDVPVFKQKTFEWNPLANLDDPS
ncbi:TraK family protein [uncultured Thiocystis sp.]|jgi:hypothetical protein|uniref:TraK family protein n=1 Tax=uncultured Thiocystis sp. TaxID=1202134 RepID=UPI0025D2052F|nr:TraK family protein [uncultured Thiocystis sp.]